MDRDGRVELRTNMAAALARPLADVAIALFNSYRASGLDELTATEAADEMLKWIGEAVHAELARRMDS